MWTTKFVLVSQAKAEQNVEEGLLRARQDTEIEAMREMIEVRFSSVLRASLQSSLSLFGIMYVHDFVKEVVQFVSTQQVLCTLLCSFLWISHPKAAGLRHWKIVCGHDAHPQHGKIDERCVLGVALPILWGRA